MKPNTYEGHAPATHTIQDEFLATTFRAPANLAAPFPALCKK